MKTNLVRFGVSLEKELLSRFDKYISQRGYDNRSKAIADLIRKEFVEEKFKIGGEVVGAVTVVYDHHKRDLVNKVLNLQHDYSDIIISTQHIHLDHNNCLEIIAVRGKSNIIKKLKDKLSSLKGIKHTTLSITSNKV